MDLDIDHLRDWIGNSETISERLTPQLVERFNATLDIEEDAVAGAEAPQMIHFCLAQLGKAEMDHLWCLGARDGILFNIQRGIEPLDELRRQALRNGLAVANPVAKMIDIKVHERVFPLRQKDLGMPSTCSAI